MRGDGFEVSGQIDLQLQLSDDVGKALPYLPQRGQKILACAGSVISPKYKTAFSYDILQDERHAVLRKQDGRVLKRSTAWRRLIDRLHAACCRLDVFI